MSGPIEEREFHTEHGLITDFFLLIQRPEESPAQRTKVKKW